jgi:transposase
MEGKSNRQIAEELIVSVSTVKCHVSNILSKMGAKSRTEAVAMALRQQGTLEDRQKSSREEIRMLNGNKKRGVRAD